MSLDNTPGNAIKDQTSIQKSPISPGCEMLLIVSQVGTTKDYIYLVTFSARGIAWNTKKRKRAKNVTRQYLLPKHVDKVKLKLRFCSLLDVVLETNEQ
jgi:hypothetical protein